MAKGKIFQYVCPHCKQSVSSTLRTGQVNHRRTCGNFFRVREGRPCAKQYDYVCPTCNGHVASNVATGQRDHRTVCGNQFSVQDGVVKEKGVVYRCPFCKRNVRSDVRTGQIDHRTVCGNQFSVQDGVVTEKGIVYRCPFCRESVRSDIRTGQINHRTVCGNRFYVKDGAVSKKTRCHAHSCPVCSTVVWSSQSCGRIAVTHVTPSRKRCQMKHWHVPDKKAKKNRKWNRKKLCAGKRQAATLEQQGLTATGLGATGRRSIVSVVRVWRLALRTDAMCRQTAGCNAGTARADGHKAWWKLPRGSCREAP